MSQFLTEAEIEDITLKPIGKLINFDIIRTITFPRKDIVNCKITGTAKGPDHLFGKGNVINCDLIDFKSDNIDFDYVDFKDCNFKGSTFLNASFDYGAIINNVFQDCIFEKAHFHNMSVTESKFSRVSFINCDLKNMIIKGCNFYECEFINCETSNKLLEECTLFNCKFRETDIQTETITENFGLAKQGLINSKIRSGRVRDNHIFLGDSHLTELLDQNDISPISRLRIAYFLNEEVFITGESLIDETFYIENWLKLCKIPSAFTNLIELYLEFLLYEYDRNKMPVYIILKFHDMTSRLVNQITLENELYKSVMGVHMTLSRIVETFLLLVYENSDEVKRPNFSLKVIGPLDLSYYQAELAPFISSEDIKIIDVRKANSPNILIFLWQNLESVVILLSLFFSTRLKIELSKYYTPKEIPETRPETVVMLPSPVIKTEGSSKPSELQLFNVDLGVAKIDQKHLYSIKLRSIMPGNLLTTLKLDISTKIISKVRDIIVDLIK